MLAIYPLCIAEIRSTCILLESQVQSLNSVFDSDTTCTYIYTVIDKHRQAQRIVSVYSLNPCVSFVLHLLLIMLLFTPRGLIPEIKSH